MADNENVTNVSENAEGVTDITETEHEHHHHHHSEHHHGEHHHHSHHHRHHHHHHKSSKKRKIKKFLTKHGKATRITAVALVIVLVVVISIVADRSFGYKNKGEQQSGGAGNIMEDKLAYIGMPVFDGKVQIVSDVAKNYVDSNLKLSVNEIVLRAGIESHDGLDRSVPVKLEFDIRSPGGSAPKSVKLQLSENSDYTNAVLYSLDNNNRVNIYNLKTGTKYYYLLEVTASDDSVTTHSGQFETENGPRLMAIDGVGNVRDIGGWKNTDGVYIKQGLLYRGTEIDGAVEPDYKLTDEGVRQMRYDLGIKLDMDLRYYGDAVAGDYILGNSIRHKYYNCKMYEGVFESEGAARIREIFADLANKANYPIYLHCTYGCDRTGTVCYILEALLGLSNSDLIKEYELSALYNEGVNKNNILVVQNTLQSYDGINMKQKAESYLLSIGVTKAEIDSIRSIFLG